MSKVQQQAYIKKHPTSKYAKMVGKGKTAASAKPTSAKKAKLDAIRDELKALQAKKGSMDAKAYATKLATIRAKIANVSGTAKPPKPGTKKPAAKKPAAKKTTSALDKARGARESHMQQKKKHAEALKKHNAELRKLASKIRGGGYGTAYTIKMKKQLKEMEKTKKSLMAKHASATAKHAAAKERVKKHSGK